MTVPDRSTLGLRILHVLDHAPPLQSGYVFRSLGILAEQRRMGFETIQLVAPRQQPGEGEHIADGWRFHRTPAPRGVFARLPLLSYMAEMRATEARILDLARTSKIDLIQAHSPALNDLPAVRAGRRLGLPVVYEVRAFWEDAAADLGRLSEGDLRWRVTRALETQVLRRADAVTTLCQGTRAEIVTRGIPAAKVMVIPNAIDPAKFSLERRPDPELAARLGLAGCTVLGFIGSFYRYEGLSLLLEALPRLVAERPEVRLLLVGGGPEEAALAAAIQAHGLERLVVRTGRVPHAEVAARCDAAWPAVVRTGRVPHAEVGRYYDLVDVFVYPRLRMRLTELVTPLKPLEAMASGRLVVASDVGGHRELVRDGETGFLFPAGDAQALATRMAGVLAAPERWPAIITAARRYVETERSWPIAAAGYRPIYQDLVAEKPAAMAAARP